MDWYKVIGCIGFAALIIYSGITAYQYLNKEPDIIINCDPTIVEFSNAHNIPIVQASSISNQFVQNIGLGGAGNQVLLDVTLPDAKTFLNESSSATEKYVFADTSSIVAEGFPGHTVVIREWGSLQKGMSYYSHYYESYVSPVWYFKPKSSTAAEIIFEEDSASKITSNLFILIFGWITWGLGWQRISRWLTNEPKAYPY